MKFAICVSAFMALWIVRHSMCVIAHKDDTHRHTVGARVNRYVKIGTGTARARRHGGIYEKRRNV